MILPKINCIDDFVGKTFQSSVPYVHYEERFIVVNDIAEDYTNNNKIDLEGYVDAIRYQYSSMSIK